MPHSQFNSGDQSWRKNKQKNLHKRKLQRSISHAAQSNRKNSFFDIIKYIITSPFQKIHKINKKQLFGKVASFVVVAGLFGSLFLVAVFGYYSRQLPDINSILTRFVAQSTKIYDRTGEVLLFEVHGNEKRTTVELDGVSPNIIYALISAEDKNFYTHKGFSIWGILRSAVKNILTGSSVGGSTLTQQMIKNTVLTNEKTYTRKIKELILSRKAEKEFTKDEILKIYLNTINYGGVNYGVEAASEAFFGKTALEVTLAESAILAALPQAPSRLSPYGNNIDQLMARKDWVLDRMEEERYISKQERDEAKKQEIIFDSIEAKNIKAPHFVFYVQQLLAEEFGEDILNQGGLKVVTTLDWEKQGFAEEIVHGANEYNLEKGATDAALVSLDAKTGEILAMIGSQDYFNDEIDGQVNVAIEPRQPGSSIKPIVYATAIEKGFTDKTVLYDVNTNFAVSGTPYQPKNYDLREHGPVTLRNALQGSLNIPAVKTLYLAGVANVMDKMQNTLGYSTITKELDCGLSLVLGGCEVTLLDHTAAYTAFARDGELAKPSAILEVYDKNGKQLYEFKPKTRKVWESEVARTMNSILSDNEARTPYFGANSYLQLGNRPVAAKTGTTNDYNDAWTIGYTPSYVTGVWVGNADGTDMKSGSGGSVVAAPIWNAFMKKIGGPIETFKSPEPLPEDLSPALLGNVGGETQVEVDRISGKLATEYTPLATRETRVYKQAHTILHYINLNDPRGPQPINPAEANPAYQTWENAVQDWVKRDFEKRKADAIAKGQEFNENLLDSAPPTEYDDVHLPEYTPSITITTPSQNETITTTTLQVAVNASAPKGVSRVDYYIDDEKIGSIYSAPYSANLSLNNITTGYHKLRAIALDDVENQSESNIYLNFKLPYTAPTINWLSPRNNGTYLASVFPMKIDFSLSRISDVKKINLYYVDLQNSEKKLMQSIMIDKEKNLSAYWLSATPGSYRLFVEFINQDNSTVNSNELNLTII